jgi:hypothetical protein
MLLKAGGRKRIGIWIAAAKPIAAERFVPAGRAGSRPRGNVARAKNRAPKCLKKLGAGLKVA